MKLFHAYVHAHKLDFSIIARSGSHAAEIFVTYWASEHGDAPDAFDISPSENLCADLRPKLQLLLKGRASGVVMFDEDDGVRLVPM